MSAIQINPHGVGFCPKCGETEYGYAYQDVEIKTNDQNQWIIVNHVRCFNKACHHCWENVYVYAGYQDDNA